MRLTVSKKWAIADIQIFSIHHSATARGHSLGRQRIGHSIAREIVNCFLSFCARMPIPVCSDQRAARTDPETKR